MSKRTLPLPSSTQPRVKRACLPLEAAASVLPSVEHGGMQQPSRYDILCGHVAILSVPSLLDSDLLRALSALLQQGRMDGCDEHSHFMFQVGEELQLVFQFLVDAHASAIDVTSLTPTQAALLGPNPLWAAASTRQEAVIKLLVQYGGLDVNSILSPDGITLLMWACARGSADITKWLLDAKANPTALSTSDSDGMCLERGEECILPPGSTPSHFAAVHDNHGALAALFKHLPADELPHLFSALNSARDTSLHVAASKGAVQVTQMLLKSRAQVDPANGDGHTPLTMAVENSCAEVAKCLLSHHAQPNSVSAGMLLLSAAVCNEDEGMVSLLLMFNANANEQPPDDAPRPLHLAARRGLPEIVGLLLEARACPHTEDDEECNAACAAVQEQTRERLDVLFTLQLAGVDLNEPTSTGLTPSKVAYEIGDAPALDFLLKSTPGVCPQRLLLGEVQPCAPETRLATQTLCFFYMGLAPSAPRVDFDADTREDLAKAQRVTTLIQEQIRNERSLVVGWTTVFSEKGIRTLIYDYMASTFWFLLQQQLSKEELDALDNIFRGCSD